MRLGLVQRGTYKTTEFDDLTGYQLEVNGFSYNFGEIISEARYRVQSLWHIECPPDLIRQRLHFSEEKFFNRMLKSSQYGIFNPHTGAHVCLGLVGQTATHNLVIHEIAHEIHYRQGGYSRADETVQEAVAILAEEEFERREFDYNPHFSSQQLLHQLNELPGFGKLTFLERWNILSQVATSQQLSGLINQWLDDNEGGRLEGWLGQHCASSDQKQHILAELALTTQSYALYNRSLVFKRIYQLEACSGQQLSGALRSLRELDRHFPEQMLTNLLEQAFARFTY